MALFGHKQENAVLAGDAAPTWPTRFGVEAAATMEQTCVDRKRQWRNAKNIRYNAAIRSAAWTATHPRPLVPRHRRGVIRARSLGSMAATGSAAGLDDARMQADAPSTRSSSGPARTGWRPRSRSPVPDARSGLRGRRRRSAAGRGPRELTLPGFRPRRLLDDPAADLARRRSSGRSTSRGAGVELVHPTRRVAHPLDGGRAVVLERSVAATGRPGSAPPTAGPGAGCSGRSSATPTSSGPELLGPVVHLPRHPLAARALRAAGAALGRRAGPGAVPGATRRGRCSRASRPTRCSSSIAR